MVASTFLLIAFLCVLPPPPVAGGKLIKHVHQDIHKLMASFAQSSAKPTYNTGLNIIIKENKVGCCKWMYISKPFAHFCLNN